MNKNIIEMVTFRVKNEISESKFLKSSNNFEKALKRDIEGFVKRSLTKEHKQNRWIELIWWDSMESAKLALKKVPQTLEFIEYCNFLEEDESEIIYLNEK